MAASPSIDRQEQLDALVGHTISIWANMESTIVSIFAMLMRTEEAKAGLVLNSINNIPAWLQIVTDLFADDPLYKKFKRNWNKKHERLREMNNIRIRLAHHTSFPPDANAPVTLRPSHLDTRMRSRAYKPLTIEQIDEFADKVAAVQSELWDLQIKMMKHEIASRCKRAPPEGGQRQNSTL